MAYLVSQATDARVTVTNLPLTHGLNLQPGDVLIAAVHWNSGTAITSDGNAFVTSFEEENPNTATSRLWIGYRVCGDSEPSSFAWSNAANDRCAVVLAQFRGIDPLNVWHVPPSASTRGIGQPVTTLASPPSLTTTNKYTVGIGIAFSDAAGFTFSDWTNGYGQEIEHGSGEGLAMVLRHYDTAGAKGTLNTTVSSSGDLVVHHLALNAIAGQPVVPKPAYIEIPTPRRVIPLRQLDSTATYSYELPASADTQAYVFGIWIEKTSAGQYDDVFAIEDDTPTWKWTFQTTNTTSPHTMAFWDDTLNNHCTISTVLELGKWYYALCCLNYGQNLAALAIFDTRGNVLGDSTLNGTDNLSSTCTHLGIGNFPSQLNEAWIGHLANLKMWRGYTQLAGVSDQANRRQFARQEMFSFRPKNLGGLIGWYPLDNQYRNRPVMRHHQILGVVGTGLSLGNRAPPPIQEEPKIITLAPPKKRRLVML